MRCRTGDLVRLDSYTVEVLFDIFQLTSEPVPIYDGSYTCSFYGGQIGLVLEVRKDPKYGEPASEFVKLLTPQGVGWLSDYYLELAT